jgi:amidase
VRHEFFTDFDKENYENCEFGSLGFLCRFAEPLIDDPMTYEKAPISIQVVARTLEEEALIAMSEIVDKALREQRGEAVKPS